MLNSLLQFFGDQAAAAAIWTVLAILIGSGLSYLLTVRADLRDEAQAAADYTEAAEATIKKAAVVAAEAFGFKTGAKGIEKLNFALDVVEEGFARAGIKGDPDSVTYDRLVRDLRNLAAEFFPPEKPKVTSRPAA